MLQRDRIRSLSAKRATAPTSSRGKPSIGVNPGTELLQSWGIDSADGADSYYYTTVLAKRKRRRFPLGRFLDANADCPRSPLKIFMEKRVVIDVLELFPGCKRFAFVPM